MSCETQRQAWEAADNAARGAIAEREAAEKSAEAARANAADALQAANNAYQAWLNCVSA